MDYTVMSGDAGVCVEPHAQVVVCAAVVGVDDGAVATAALRRKMDEHGIRFVDSLGYYEVDVRMGTEGSIGLRSPSVSRLRTGCWNVHEELGRVERMDQSMRDRSERFSLTSVHGRRYDHYQGHLFSMVVATLR